MKRLCINIELKQIESIRLPRLLGTHKGNEKWQYELHGFSDASETAYAAVVYIRIIGEDSPMQTFLVAAKSRVAPLKKIRLPRLELQAALLLANLMPKVEQALQLKIRKIGAWTVCLVETTPSEMANICS